MTDAGAQLADAVATIDATACCPPESRRRQAPHPSRQTGPRAKPFAGLRPQEFPLLAQAAEAGALSDGLADVLSFAVNGMIAAIEAKAPPAKG